MVYVISDLHGYPLDKLQEVFKRVNFSDEDRCFVLGDVIDRGTQSIALLRWIMEQPNITFILGNHEAMMLDCAFLFEPAVEKKLDNLKPEDMEAFETWIFNGGRETIRDLTTCDDATILKILDFLKNAPLYQTVCVNDKDYLLVHSGLGGFAPDKSPESYSPKELLWTRPQLTQTYYADTVTVLGHTPTYFYGGQYRGKVLFTDTWIDIDTGAAYGEKPALLRLDDQKVFYLT